MLASTEAQVVAAAADVENARLTLHAHAGPREAGCRLAAGARSGAHGVRGGPGEARLAQAAGRGAARDGRACALECRADRRCAAARSQTNQHMQAAAAAQRAKADVRLAYTEITRRSTASSTSARRAPAKYVDAGPADRDADQPGRPVGPRRRRGDLHRSRAARRQADRPPALRRRARRARCSTAASTRRSRRSATSAGPSATSRPSRSGCASTTRIAGSPLGMTAYVFLHLD